jgi:hypothetical protein
MSKSPKSGDRRRAVEDPPDLQTQLESMLDQVWRSEAQWRLYDRIDAFCAARPDHCGLAGRTK